MLARMNYAADLATKQKFNLRDAFRGKADSPEALVDTALSRLTAPEFPGDDVAAFVNYVAWLLRLSRSFGMPQPRYTYSR